MATAELPLQTIPLPDEPESQEPETQEEGLGDWNERLDPELQDCLKRLCQHFADEFRYPRRLEVMAAWKARCFWREMQHLMWNWESECWEALGPAGTKAGSQAEKYDSAVLYSTNLFQGFGESYIAIITQSTPNVRFEPEDPDEPADIETAKAAEPMRKIIQHENDPVKLMTKAAYYSFTEGRMHGWTTWEVDRRTNKPREMQRIKGAMEVKVPVVADEQSDFLYLQYSDEYHVATVRAKVKGRAFDEGYWKKIKGGSTGNGQDMYERTARISAKQGISMRSAGGDTYANLVTTQRTWMRPDAFLCEDIVTAEQFNELTKLFPNGAYAEFDNGTYTGSRDANMDDEWTVENIMEGDGQFRNGKGTCLISVQERSNDIINTAQDVYEKTQPASYWDDKMFDVDGMRRQRSMPGARYGIALDQTFQVGDTIGAHVFFEPAATVSADMLQYLKELMTDVPQFLTGISAILFGQDTGGDKSGKALSIQQNMAMGRIGLPWRTMKRFYAKMMEQAIRCAARNRKEDVAQGIPDQNGEIETVQVRIEELSGKVRCFAEDDEGIPMSPLEKRNAYVQLMTEANADPILRQTLALPKNQEMAKKLIGLDLEILGASSWNKQLREINLLLAEPPKVIPAKVAQIPNPLSGDLETVQIPETKQASIGIDADWDDNEQEYLTVRIFVNSAKGQQLLAQKGPQALDNVKLHGNLHKQALQKAMAAMQPPPAPPTPPAIHIHGPHGSPKSPTAGSQPPAPSGAPAGAAMTPGIAA